MSGALGQIWQRLRLVVAQGVGTLIGAQHVQAKVLDGEVLPKVRRVEPYGLSYRPKPGCEVYMVFPDGDRAQGLALVIGDRRYQMELLEGEVALHDDEENFVRLGRGGVITVKANTRVVADCPVFEATGDVTIAGRLTAVGGVEMQGSLSVAGGAEITGALTNNGISVGSGHRHRANGMGEPTGGSIGD